MDEMQVGRVGSARCFQGRLRGWCGAKGGGQGGLRQRGSAVTREAGRGFGGGGQTTATTIGQDLLSTRLLLKCNRGRQTEAQPSSSASQETQKH